MSGKSIKGVQASIQKIRPIALNVQCTLCLPYSHSLNLALTNAARNFSDTIENIASSTL